MSPSAPAGNIKGTSSRGASRLAGLLVGTLAASALLFTKLAVDVAGSGPMAALDGATAAWLHAHATGFVTGVLTAVTQLGGAMVLIPVALAAGVALVLRRRTVHAALVVAALIGGEALNLGLKAAFERPRPSFADTLATASGFSFPSGHAMVALTVYGALAFVLAAGARSRRTRLFALGAAAALVLAIGFSRLYLGVHYVSDVLAAYSAGLAWLMVCGLTALAVSRLRAGRSGGPAVAAPATAGSAVRRTSSAPSS